MEDGKKEGREFLCLLLASDAICSSGGSWLRFMSGDPNPCLLYHCHLLLTSQLRNVNGLLLGLVFG